MIPRANWTVEGRPCIPDEGVHASVDFRLRSDDLFSPAGLLGDFPRDSNRSHCVRRKKISAGDIDECSYTMQMCDEATVGNPHGISPIRRLYEVGE